MIVIEQLYFRRGEDAMVFGAQDVNIQPTCVEAPTVKVPSKTNVKTDGETQGQEERPVVPAVQRRSRVLNLLRCCLPLRSAAIEKDQTEKIKADKPRKNKVKISSIVRGLFGRKTGNGQSNKTSRSILRRHLIGSKPEAKVHTIEEISQSIEQKYAKQLELYNSI